jgi:hypothetical protein
LPDGLDPADLLTQGGPAALTAALISGRALGDQLLGERLDNLAPEQARVAALRIIAARPSHTWTPATDQVCARFQLAQVRVRQELRDAVKAWDADPCRAAQTELHNSHQVRARLNAAAALPPAQRWATLAREIDPHLLEQDDWAATAAILQRSHDRGLDVNTATRALVAQAPLGVSPARDLRYRLVAHFGSDEQHTASTDGDTVKLQRTEWKQQPASPDPGRRDVRR